LDSYQNSGPGPGAYDTIDEFDELTKKIAGSKNKDKQFGVSKRSLFNDSASKNGASQPGPGHYQQGPYGDMNEWYKKTFNFRYLKQQQTGDPNAIALATQAALSPMYDFGTRAKSNLVTI
jgi:hypothetical protein